MGIGTAGFCKPDEVSPSARSALFTQVVEQGIRWCPIGTMQAVLGDPECLPVEDESEGASIAVLAWEYERRLECSLLLVSMTRACVSSICSSEDVH